MNKILFKKIDFFLFLFTIIMYRVFEFFNRVPHFLQKIILKKVISFAFKLRSLLSCVAALIEKKKRKINRFLYQNNFYALSFVIVRSTFECILFASVIFEK